MHRTATSTPSRNPSRQASAPLALAALCAALAGAVFAVDVALPLGFAGAVPYVAVVILASRLPDPRSVFIAAALCTGLTVLGFLLSEPGADRVVAVANRTLAGLALWATAGLMHAYARRRYALEESEERFDTLYRRAPAMLLSLDERGRIVSASDHWLRVMGYERDEVVGRAMTELVAPEDRERARDSDPPALCRSGKIDDLECRFVKKDGTTMDVLLSAIARYDADAPRAS